MCHKRPTTAQILARTFCQSDIDVTWLVIARSGCTLKVRHAMLNKLTILYNVHVVVYAVCGDVLVWHRVNLGQVRSARENVL